MPGAPAVARPFVAWLEQITPKVAAERLQVSAQTVRNWIGGAGVRPTRHAALKLEAAKDGVILTTDDLIGFPAQ